MSKVVITAMTMGNRGGEREMKTEIRVSQVESRLLIEVDGEILPDIFSEYRWESSNTGKSELSLTIRGDVSVSELSTSLKVQKR